MTDIPALPRGAKAKVIPYTVSIAEEKLQRFQQLIDLSPIGPETYENQLEDRRYGVSRKWLNEAKKEWIERFDWREKERHMNRFPHYLLPVTDDDGHTYMIHFVALFSSNPSAVPVAFFHGWPGGFLEFLPLLDLLHQRYPGPNKLPYHFVIPSLPGFAFSSRPPLDKNFETVDASRLMNKLLCELGFGESGHIAQGGDIGSFVTTLLALNHAECKAMHTNLAVMAKPDAVPESAIDGFEASQLARAETFSTTGTAYALEHGTRPATIGLALSASPIALLAWIGEKSLAWTDADPPVDTILEAVSPYWLTDTFPTSIFPYREDFGPGWNRAYCEKPMGYSYFPYELLPIPKAWVATLGNLVWHIQHRAGGHFAALEKPEWLLNDAEDFVKTVRGGK